MHQGPPGFPEVQAPPARIDLGVVVLIALAAVLAAEGAGEEAAASAPLLRALMNTVPAVVLVLNGRGRVLLVNRFTERLTGRRRKELVGEDWCAQFIPRTERGLFRKSVQQTLKTRRPRRFCTRLLSEPRGERVISWTLSVLPKSAGPSGAVLAFGLDVTEERSAQEQLASSEAHYRSLVENAVDMIYCLNLRGELTYVSPALLRALGYSRKELLGKYSQVIIAEEDHRKTHEAFQRRIRGEQVPPYEFHLRRKDGSLLPVEITSNVIYSPEGRPLGTQAILRDVSRRRQMQEKMDRLNRIIGTVRRINQLIAREQDRDRLLKRSCEILVDTGDHLTAWMALVDEEGGFLTAAQAGLGRRFSALLKGLRRGRWPFCAAEALGRAGVVRIPGPEVCGRCPLATGEGWSAACTRLQYGGRTYGLLTVSMPAHLAGREEEESLLREVADDLALAFHHLEVEAERRRAEARLKQERDFNATLVQASPTFFVAVGADGKTIMMNQAMLDALGYSAEEVAGTDYLRTFVPAEDRKMLRGVFRRLLAGQGPTLNVNRVLTKDGRRLLVEWRGRSVLKETGEVDFFFGVGVDITERRRAEEELRRSQQRYRYLFEESPVINLVIGADGTIKQVNRAAEELMGYSRTEVVGKPALEFVLPRDRRKALTSLAKSLRDEYTPSIDLAVRAKDGSTHVLLFSPGQVVLYENDRPSAIVVTAMDITERRRAEEALRESEAKYSALVEQASDGVVIIQDEVCKFANRALAEITGYSVEELRGKPFAELLVPEERERLLARYRSRMAGEKVPSRYETKILCKDGTPRDVEISAGIIRYQGRPADMAIVRDITERKQAEQALRESEKRFRTITAAAQDAIIMVDSQGRISYWNQAATRIFGYRAEEVMGRAAHSLLAPRRYRKLWERGMERFRKTGQGPVLGRTLEFEARRKDGTLFPAELSVSAVQLGGQWHAVGVVRDVSERVEARRNLKESEQLYRALTERSVTGVAIVQEGRLRYVNPRIEETLGLSAEALKEKPVAELIHPEDRARGGELIRRVLAGETVLQAELRIIPSRGAKEDLIWVRLNATRIDYQGRPAVLVNAIDITQEKRLEQQLIQTEKLTAIGELTSGVAHELNNPLAAILGYAELARDLGAEGELAQYLEQIAQQAVRASAIVGNLLTFARQKEPERRPVSLNAVVQAAADLRRYDLRTSNVELALELDRELPAVMGDFQQLTQVVLNLINNADYAVRQHRGFGTITIRTRPFSLQGRPGVRLEVLDDGPGIPEAHLGRIFDPFFTTKEPGRGTGLGLSVSFGIVTSHQGFIYAENRPEGGARFVVELPAATVTEGAAPTETAEVPEVSPADILVVEDEEAVARMLARMLRQDGHRAEVAADAVQALERLRETSYDLLLVDIKMPGMSGLEFHRRLQEEFPALSRAVVFITGDVLTAETRQFVEERAVPVLAKPFELAEARRFIYRKLQEVQGGEGG